jgi:capsular polysaccharide transport system permease protein
MADSPIRLPSASNRDNGRGQERDITAADTGPAPVALTQDGGERGAVIVHALPWPARSASLAGWARRVGIIKLVWFLLVVALPTIGSAIYYFSIAANQYVSEFLCVVQPVEDQGDSSDSGGFRSSGSASRTVLESNVVVQYIRSAEIVNLLEQQIGLRALYSTGSADIFSRLDPHASNEELLAYWDSKVEPFYDITTGTVSVKVKAFTAQDAQMIASQVIHLSENLVNAMSARARRDTVKTDEQEVNKAADQLHQISAQILAFRNLQQMIDPKKEAESSLSLLSKLREQLALARADLATYGTATEAPGARVVQNRIVALQQQIAAASAPMTSAAGSPNDRALSTSVGGFEDLDTKRVVAEKYYDSALATLEKARYDADRQMTYLAVFVEPNLPQTSIYPRRAISVVLTLLAGFGIWIFGIVIVHSIREHI